MLNLRSALVAVVYQSNGWSNLHETCVKCWVQCVDLEVLVHMDENLWFRMLGLTFGRYRIFESRSSVVVDRTSSFESI